MPHLTEAQRRALQLLLAGSENGCTETLLMAHGVSNTMIAELILAGLARADGERMVVGRKAVQVRRIRITDAGRQIFNGSAT